MAEAISLVDWPKLVRILLCLPFGDGLEYFRCISGAHTIHVHYMHPITVDRALINRLALQTPSQTPIGLTSNSSTADDGDGNDDELGVAALSQLSLASVLVDQVHTDIS